MIVYSSSTRTFNLFTLEDGITGLTRALFDAGVQLERVVREPGKARMYVFRDDNRTVLTLCETESLGHPLSRLGAVFAVEVSFDNRAPWIDLDNILTLGFLRGGG